MNQRIRAGVMLALLLSGFLSLAQERTIINESVLWTQFTLKTNFGEKYGASFGSQYRAFLDRENGYHLFFTVGVTRKLGYGFTAGVGFTNLNINQFRDTDFVLVPEIRPYQSIAFSQVVGKSKFSWKFMVEQRFFRNARNGELVSGYTKTWRFRNKAAYSQYLSEKWRFILSSEVMFNAGDITVNVFDQHRAQFLFGYKMGVSEVNFGYMHWFFQTANNRQENRHTLVIAFTHSI